MPGPITNGVCRHSASIHLNKTPRFPNVTAGTKKLLAERYDEVNARVKTISLHTYFSTMLARRPNPVQPKRA